MVEYDKQKLSHDNQNGKWRKYTSQIYILETFSQRFVINLLRDFWTASNYENTKIDIFIGHFSNRYS